MKDKKKIRNELNKEVRKLKRKRSELDDLLKQARVEARRAASQEGGRVSQTKKSLRGAKKKQQKAHEDVVKASERSEEAHGAMMNLSSKVDRLRAKANACHKAMQESKDRADSSHEQVFALYYRIQGAIRVQVGPL